MNKPKRDNQGSQGAPDRTSGELEDGLKAAERRIAEVRDERDRSDALIGKMQEAVKEAQHITESYRDPFQNHLNRMVGFYNPKALGRPLNAAPAQC